MLSLSACGANAQCACGVLNGATQLGPCITCLQSLNPSLAQQVNSAAQDCATLFPTSGVGHTLTPINQAPPNPTPGSPTQCSSECSPIVQATSCTDSTCSCSAYVLAGADCLQCTGALNLTLSSSIAAGIAGCLSQILTNSATVTIPSATAQGPCDAQCAPLAQAQSCTAASCSCPAYLSAGASCLQCIGTLNSTASRSISSGIANCLTQRLQQTPSVITALPCASECSNIIQIETCTNEQCSCSAILREGSACYTCTNAFNASAGAILSRDMSVCESDFPALGTIAPTPQACFTPCAFTSQIAAVCGSTSLDLNCFCPTFVSSVSPCAACYETVNITQAVLLSSALGICSSSFPALFTKTAGPTSSVATGPVIILTTVHSTSGTDGVGLLDSTGLVWTIALAVILGAMTVFI